MALHDQLVDPGANHLFGGALHQAENFELIMAVAGNALVFSALKNFGNVAGAKTAFGAIYGADDLLRNQQRLFSGHCLGFAEADITGAAAWLFRVGFNKIFGRVWLAEML